MIIQPNSVLELKLKLKQNSTGIVSWSTRAQLGGSVGILATTGFQSNGYTNEEMV